MTMYSTISVVRANNLTKYTNIKVVCRRIKVLSMTNKFKINAGYCAARKQLILSRTLRVCVTYRWGLDWMIEFIDHLYIPL
jgi:hypothetical protein